MRTVVGVLRGGPSSEYDVSLKTGAAVLSHLDKEKYEPHDIFISRSGEWHNRGIATEPTKALAGVDVVFNALHGHYGEDGQLHEILDPLGVPYTGADKLSSVLAFNKARTKEAVSGLGVKVAHSVVLEPADDVELLAQELFRTFPHPAVVKPITGGSSLGITVVQKFNDLAPALIHASSISPKVLVEEYIPGREAIVGVLDSFRNEPVYALIPEPNIFSDSEKQQLTELAKRVHQALGLRHYSQSDFIVGKRGIYFLEVTALPKLHQDSAFTQALENVGARLPQFLDHVLQLART